MEAQRLADESARLAEMEEEARHRLRLSRLDAKEDLKRQIETKRERIAAERAKDEADDRKMYDADAEYKDMIDKIKNSEPPRWYGRRKVDWFY